MAWRACVSVHEVFVNVCVLLYLRSLNNTTHSIVKTYLLSMVNVVYDVLLKKLSFLRQWGNINLFFSGSSSVSLLKYVMNFVLFNTLPIGLICSLDTVCVPYMIKLVKLLWSYTKTRKMYHYDYKYKWVLRDEYAKCKPHLFQTDVS